ncbi:hypothetical protein [Aureispira anguillae]|uniref:Uncharacterized protein n=1 Tax=Aureispira anguillae TaxID=2864201 RepID=A0A915YEK9_9BACT|nr:hypothetical protein [Aureispira anguillae]BDS11610.1 hypothetical protein AsAng_0023240 [Aureispira anguillae]
MKEKSTFKFEIKNLQELISIGYLSLLVFGIIRESITYGILGINIMYYSSVLDILLSPIIILTTDLAIAVFVVVIPILFYWILRQIGKFHHKHKTKEWYKKRIDVAGMEESFGNKNSLPILLVFMTHGLLLGIFLSDAVIGGYALQKKIANKEQKMSHQITFMDKEKLKVKIIGQNSQYLFYILDQQTEISISPIQGNIKRIEQLKK